MHFSVDKQGIKVYNYFCYLMVAEIMCREPGRHSTLDKGHEEGGSALANAGPRLSGPPGY